jgi:hypothetical protein
MSSNLATSVPNQTTDRSTLTDRTPLLKPSCMLRFLLIGFMPSSIFNLLIFLVRCCTELIMCSINVDEFATHVSIVALLSRLCVPFSEKLDSLLDRLDNWCMKSWIVCLSRLCVTFSEKLDSLLDRLDNRRVMHGFQYDVLLCAQEMKRRPLLSAVTLHGL